MKYIKNLCLLSIFCLLTLSLAAQTTLQDKLKAISSITEIKSLESNEFAEKYALYNKCNNAIHFLSNAIVMLDNKIKAAQEEQTQISMKIVIKL